jgi:hypothetical protein
VVLNCYRRSAGEQLILQKALTGEQHGNAAKRRLGQP